MKPVIEFPHTAGKCRAVVFAEGLDRFDQASSTELTVMALQRFDQGGRRARLAADCREKCVAIGPLQNHALMLIQQPARALDGKIACGESSYRHGLLDYSFCRRRYTKLQPLRFEFSARRR